MAFEEWATRLEEDGFFVWPALVPEGVVNTHLEAYTRWTDLRVQMATDAWRALPRSREVEMFQEDYDWRHASETVQALFWQPRLVAFLTELFSGAPVMRAPQTGLRTRSAPMHADALTPMVDPTDAEVRVWIALEDIRCEAGPFYLVPGTHRTIMPTLRDYALTLRPEFRDLLRALLTMRRRRDERNATYELIEFTNRTMERLCEKRRLPRVVPTLRKGDAVVFRPNVAHGSMPCSDKTLTRKHALSFFAAPHARWFNDDAYWGRDWDRRSEATRLPWQVEQSAWGPRIKWIPDEPS